MQMPHSFKSLTFNYFYPIVFRGSISIVFPYGILLCEVTGLAGSWKNFVWSVSFQVNIFWLCKRLKGNVLQRLIWVERPFIIECF